MKKINWEVRVKNPVFWIGLIGAIGTPILAYFGINASDLTSWGKIGDTFLAAISNPYLIGIVLFSVMSFLGVAVDPTTKGILDSNRALSYTEPHDDAKHYKIK